MLAARYVRVACLFAALIGLALPSAPRAAEVYSGIFELVEEKHLDLPHYLVGGVHPCGSMGFAYVSESKAQIPDPESSRPGEGINIVRFSDYQRTKIQTRQHTETGTDLIHCYRDGRNALFRQSDYSDFPGGSDSDPPENETYAPLSWTGGKFRFPVMSCDAGTNTCIPIAGYGAMFAFSPDERTAYLFQWAPGSSRKSDAIWQGWPTDRRVPRPQTTIDLHFQARDLKSIQASKGTLYIIDRIIDPGGRYEDGRMTLFAFDQNGTRKDLYPDGFLIARTERYYFLYGSNFRMRDDGKRSLLRCDLSFNCSNFKSDTSCSVWTEKFLACRRAADGSLLLIDLDTGDEYPIAVPKTFQGNRYLPMNWLAAAHRLIELNGRDALTVFRLARTKR